VSQDKNKLDKDKTKNDKRGFLKSQKDVCWIMDHSIKMKHAYWIDLFFAIKAHCVSFGQKTKVSQKTYDI
jgi:hypothetical protein